MRDYRINNNGNNHNGGNRAYTDIFETNKTEVSNEYKNYRFNTEWIKTGATTEMVTFAESSGKYMANNGLKSSKIRGIYGEIKRIQMKGLENAKTDFYLLKPKVAYAVGREKANMKEIKGIIMFQMIFDQSFAHVKDNTTYKNFCNLMEAIIAYHKAYVKNDK